MNLTPTFVGALIGIALGNLINTAMLGVSMGRAADLAVVQAITVGGVWFSLWLGHRRAA